jgi:hypothetical protein
MFLLRTVTQIQLIAGDLRRLIVGKNMKRNYGMELGTMF